MEKAIKQYSSWARENLPENLKAEAEAIKGNDEEICDRFCRDMDLRHIRPQGKDGPWHQQNEQDSGQKGHHGSGGLSAVKARESKSSNRL